MNGFLALINRQMSNYTTSFYCNPEVTKCGGIIQWLLVMLVPLTRESLSLRIKHSLNVRLHHNYTAMPPALA